jgi:5,5'-dehydrodivanillate O-demethylase
MGPPERTPLLPRYEVLVREDGTRQAECYPINSNYLQNIEGALDTVHAPYLHMNHWSKVKATLATMPKAQIEFVETDYGIWQRSCLPIPDPAGPITGTMYGHFFMPAGFMRIQESFRIKGLVQKFQSWYVPIDDTHTMRLQVAFSPLLNNGEPYEWPSGGSFDQPGPENDYFRDYEETDTISGIPVTTVASSGVKGFLAQDNMVNETQGAVVDRTKEHLGALDKVLAAMRVIYLLAIEDVRRSRDPKHIIRDPERNRIVYIGGDGLETK